MSATGPTGQQAAGIRPAVLFIPMLLIILGHISRYGMTFDEARFIHDAHQLAGWIRGTADTEEVWFGAEHPSPAKILGALGYLPVRDFRALRIFTAMLYALAAIAVYGAVRRPRGPAAGVLVLASLILAPPFFAYSAQASNESVVSALTLLLLATASRARAPREWFVAGFIAGLALGTKITALVGIIAVPVWAWRCAPSGNFSRRSFLLFALALFTGFLCAWPALALNPRAVLDHVAHFAALPAAADEAARRPATLFFGFVDSPPWYYAPLWLAIGLPPLLLLGAAIELWKGAGPLTRLLRIHIATGLLSAIAFHSYLREGIRHLLPVAVVVAVAGGLGAARLAGWRARGYRYLLVIVLVAGSFVFSLIRQHPAESFYVSELAGGPAAAARWKLPITSSGDILSHDMIRELPEGSYAVIPGASCDRPLNFYDPMWRAAMNRHAAKWTSEKVRFTIPQHADYLLVLGAGEKIGIPLLERGGITYVSRLRNPVGFELILTDTGAVIPQRQ